MPPGRQNHLDCSWNELCASGMALAPEAPQLGTAAVVGRRSLLARFERRPGDLKMPGDVKETPRSCVRRACATRLPRLARGGGRARWRARWS